MFQVELFMLLDLLYLFERLPDVGGLEGQVESKMQCSEQSIVLIRPRFAPGLCKCGKIWRPRGGTFCRKYPKKNCGLKTQLSRIIWVRS